MSIDRAALIEAAAAPLRSADDPDWFQRSKAGRVLDAILPLIADALAMSRIEMYDEAPPGIVTYDFAVNVKSKAARLVRSLLSTDSDAATSPSLPARPETGE